ncbi:MULTISPECIES: hypothetical protein [Actinosynnema]|uniref:hypothetical protein n=1 Tax=Actinosynnema TaxID=40566 RepID=UPI0020A55034|nr:hypothetical protein [Actinosynnema pretiosum]MCP2098899.1 hypothetical protein [Actinosynnema pretiosum]
MTSKTETTPAQHDREVDQDAQKSLFRLVTARSAVLTATAAALGWLLARALARGGRA